MTELFSGNSISRISFNCLGEVNGQTQDPTWQKKRTS